MTARVFFTLVTLSFGVATGAAEIETADALNSALRGGKYTEAEQGARDRLAALEADEPRSPAVAATLDILIEALWRGGKAGDDETVALAERAIELKRSVYGAGHPALAVTLDHLGVVRLVRGEFQEARASLDAAERIAVAAGAENHPEASNLILARIKGHLAPVAQELGNYSDADDYYAQTIALLETADPVDRRRIAMTENNLATLRRWMGDYAAALRLYQKALAVLRDELGEAHPLIGIGLSNVGELQHKLGDFDEAQSAYTRAIELKEAALGPEHPSVATTLINLGELHEQRGELDMAQGLLERALAIQKTVLPEDHASLALTLTNLADVTRDTAKPAEIEALYRRAVTIRQKSFGANHPLVAASLLRLAQYAWQTGDAAAATDWALQAERIARDFTRLVLRALSEDAALDLLDARVDALDLLTEIAAANGAVGREAAVWYALSRSRALVLDEMATRQRSIGASGDETLHRLAGEYRASSARLAHLFLSGARGNVRADYRARIEQAEAQHRALEQKLARQSLPFRPNRDEPAGDFSAVVAALPPAAMLLSYRRYQRLDGMGAAYLALVYTQASERVRLIPLGDAARIETKLRRWRGEILGGIDFPGRSPQAAEAAYRKAANALRQLVWDPVAPAAQDADLVFIVPDGALHLVNFGALTAPDGRFLAAGIAPLHYLSTERDLRAHAGGADSVQQGRLLVLSGADFGAVPARKGAAARGDGADCASSPVDFAPLPGAQQEGQAVASLWRRNLGRDGVTHLSGAAATETAFKQLAPAHGVVHLATHGFFLSGACPSQRPALDNPLLFSGLALAGANVSRDGDVEDGILTAQEVAGLDLHGVRMAMLSGCNTGVGQLHAGEGVLGLRRAFQIAGVDSVVMSLWPLVDATAREWVAIYYDARHDGARIPAAVRRANLRTADYARERFGTDHPFYWAGFVAGGAWQ